MKKLKTTALILLGVLLILATGAFVFAWAFEDRIKEKIVSEINGQLTVPVKVEGGINLSLFRHFPYVSLTFAKVSINDKVRKQNTKLVEVEEISFLCNVFSLLGDEIEFSKIVIAKGQFNMYTDAAGNSNYDIFKQSEVKPGAAPGENKLSIQLKRAEVKDLRYQYQDEVQGVNIDARIYDGQLKGNFSDVRYEMEISAGMYINKLLAAGQDYISGRNVTADLVLQIDKAKNRYDFRNGKVRIEECDFDVNGYIALPAEGTQLDFRLENTGQDVQQLISLLPLNYKASMAKANGKGEYTVAASVKGLVSKTTAPAINIGVTLKNSTVQLGNLNKSLKNVNAIASYESDEKGRGKVVIKNFSCLFDGRPFSFKLTVANFGDPVFDFYADGAMELSEFSTFIPDDILKGLQGAVAFHDFHLSGRKRDFTDVLHSTLKGSGNFRLTGVQFTSNGVQYAGINGLLNYKDQVIDAQGFTLAFLGSDFNFTGTVDNLFAFVYNLDAKRKQDNIVLGVNGLLQVKKLDLNEILKGYTSENANATAATAPATETSGSRITVRDVLSMRGNLDVEIGQFRVRKMEFDNIRGNLQIVPGMIRINSLATRTMGGEVRSQAILYFTPQNSLRAKCDISAVGLDIPRIFRECESFGQTTLTDKHLKGTITTSVSFDAEWLNYEEVDTRTFTALVDFRIKDGELINFEPLRAASKFIRVQELNDIRFAELANTIKIANGRITIPEFEIKNSALNLMFSGFHSFNNTIDYHMKVNLHKLLARKFNRKADESQYIEGDPYEGINIYLSMAGDISNPKIQFDKASARKKFHSDMAQGKRDFKNLFNDTPKTNQDNKREEKYFNIKEEPAFMDFDTDDN